MKKIFTLICFISSLNLLAQENSSSASKDLFDMSLEELLNIEADIEENDFKIYGYINSNLQKTFGFPTAASDISTIRTDDPMEWSPVQNFHIFGQGNLSNRIGYLFNLAATSEMISVRNAWGNFAIKDYAQIRVGKMYRKFGLYNERLDQIPTFIGIEAPEMLDTDHLFLPRTTNLMIHGKFGESRNQFSYALMTENGENGPAKNVVPIGWDLRYKSTSKSLIAGFSGYTSSITKTKSLSTVEIGNGSPKGGILPWMSGDKYVVAGFFVEKQLGKLLIQSEFYNANHKAERNPESTLLVIREADINRTQRNRFLSENSEKSNSELTEDDVKVHTNYNVQTWYIRLDMIFKLV